MTRRLVIASFILLLVLLTLAIVGMGRAMDPASQGPSRRVAYGTMSGEFAHFPIAGTALCAAARAVAPMER